MTKNKPVDPKDYFEYFETLPQAVEHVLWMKHKYRLSNLKFGVVHGPDNNFASCEDITASEHGLSFIDVVPENLVALNYPRISKIYSEDNPLLPWESIKCLFCEIDKDLLSFILEMKIPLEKFIRFELASRGYDQNNRWIGVEQAKECWLTIEEK